MGIIILVLIASVAGYYIWFQRQQMQEMSELYTLEKERMFDQIEEINLQYEGTKFSINNDSLFSLLVTEQEKVQRLKEELSTVKSTNVRRINELNKELETLRKIMRNYLVQIDSLSSENEKLKVDNKQMTQRYQQASSTAAQLRQRNEQLTGQVQLAQRLDAVNIQIKAINARGRDAKIDKATQLVMTFVIAKNISAPVGEHTIYVCLFKPDDSQLIKANYGTFKFENKDIPWSMRYNIEYDGEEKPITLYWDIEEYLSPGTYRAQVFAAGNRIGNRSFVLEK